MFVEFPNVRWIFKFASDSDCFLVTFDDGHIFPRIFCAFHGLSMNLRILVDAFRFFLSFGVSKNVLGITCVCSFLMDLGIFKLIFMIINDVINYRVLFDDSRIFMRFCDLSRFSFHGPKHFDMLRDHSDRLQDLEP